MNTSTEQVIETLKAEFEYSQRWDKIRESRCAPDHQMDRNKPVESWILWMEQYLANARLEATRSTDKTAALHEVRKAAALALACLTYCGCPPRDKS